MMLAKEDELSSMKYFKYLATVTHTHMHTLCVSFYISSFQRTTADLPQKICNCQGTL